MVKIKEITSKSKKTLPSYTMESYSSSNSEDCEESDLEIEEQQSSEEEVEGESDSEGGEGESDSEGEEEAIEIVEVPNRYLAGITEVALKDHVADKTNWRKMLKNDIEDANLLEWRDNLKEFIPDEAKDYFIENNIETHLKFPVNQYPEKPNSLNIKKLLDYSGKLVGIKGQYLIFEDNTVFNIRANEGLVVELNIV